MALNVVIRRNKRIQLDLRQILSVGVPTAGENLSYNLAQMVNLRFVASFGTTAVSAYVFLGSFLNLFQIPLFGIFTQNPETLAELQRHPDSRS